jgi:hypothetical protein
MPTNKINPRRTPRTEKAQAIAADIKSIIRNTLLASPDFPIIYQAVVRSAAPNSNEARILAADYKKNIESTRTDRTTMPSTKICTHIKVAGVRCGSPALRGEQFCYFHQRMIRTVKGPASRLHHVALLENEEAIQASVMEVVNALIRGTIELKRGELILRALNTAVRNARRAHFDLHTSMITKIPDYAEPPEPPEAPEQLDPTRKRPTPAEIYMGTAASPARASVGTAASPSGANVGTAAPGCPGGAAAQNVGTDVFVRPSGPEVPGRSDPTIKKNAAIDPTQRKPPKSVREPEAPKERKIKAHRASGG